MGKGRKGHLALEKQKGCACKWFIISLDPNPLVQSPTMVASANGELYTFHPTMNHDEGPQSSEEGSGMHSPVLYGPPPGDCKYLVLSGYNDRLLTPSVN